MMGYLSTKENEKKPSNPSKLKKNSSAHTGENSSTQKTDHIQLMADKKVIGFRIYTNRIIRGFPNQSKKELRVYQDNQ